MTSPWKDFKTLDDYNVVTPAPSKNAPSQDPEVGVPTSDCDWGFAKADCESDLAQADAEHSKFIQLYEEYLSDRKSLDIRTKNHQFYASNPSDTLREWFESEGHDFGHKLEQTCHSQYKCSLDIPLGEHDFHLESECHQRKQSAIEEVCLLACKLLDACDLLKFLLPDQNTRDPDRKRRIEAANKEDDIELDNTQLIRSHESRPKKTTLQSLKSEWTQLNMTILGLKAKLVKLDLSVSKQVSGNTEKKTDTDTGDEDEDEDEDPLDAFMSNLDKKSELTLDEKIEKSRIKSQISSLERKQEEISELLNEINS